MVLAYLVTWAWAGETLDLRHGDPVGPLQGRQVPLVYEGPLLDCPGTVSWEVGVPAEETATALAAAAAECVTLAVVPLDDRVALVAAEDPAALALDQEVELRGGVWPVEDFFEELLRQLAPTVSGGDLQVHSSRSLTVPAGRRSARELLTQTRVLNAPGRDPEAQLLLWRVSSSGGRVWLGLRWVDLTPPSREVWVDAIPLDRPPRERYPTDRVGQLRIAVENARADTDPWMTAEEHAASVAWLESLLAAEIAKQAASDSSR